MLSFHVGSRARAAKIAGNSDRTTISVLHFPILIWDDWRQKVIQHLQLHEVCRRVNVSKVIKIFKGNVISFLMATVTFWHIKENFHFIITQFSQIDCWYENVQVLLRKLVYSFGFSIVLFLYCNLFNGAMCVI